ncbi:MAG: glucose-6-phosphate isomerase, partial [Candidatus Aenigmarchaeota archaeon]|nr:glucose-6-phosphate isomerase [Candidatus Aenigmarchaeota archaeon]
LHEFGGCAYFFTHEGIIKNPKYIHTEGALKENKPLDASLIGLGDKEPMYHLIQRVSRLEFLTKPQDFSELFEKALG